MAGKFGETEGNRRKSFGNIFKTHNKNEQILTAAEFRIYCKSGIVICNFHTCCM